MSAANIPNDTVHAAKQALEGAEQALVLAEQNRATAVAEAQRSLTIAIAVLSAVQETAASTVVKARHTDNVANAEKNIATVTAQCDEQVERAENAVKVAKNALRWVVQATLNGVQDKAKYQAAIACVTITATKVNQKMEKDALIRENEARLAKLERDQATMLASEEANAHQNAVAIEAQRVELEELLKQLLAWSRIEGSLHAQILLNFFVFLRNLNSYIIS